MKLRYELTPEEQTNVRTALRFLKTKCGTWTQVAAALGFSESMIWSIDHGRRSPSPIVVFNISRFAHVGVDEILRGTWPSPNCCRHCGRCPTDEVKP